MTFWQSVLAILNAPMERPTSYGWFHLLFIALTFLALIPLCRHPKHPTGDHVRRVVFVTALIVTALEIYKQVRYSFSYQDGVIFDYQWYIFPFQFCSTPMYVGLLAGILKKGKVYESLCAYLATFALFAGAAVMVYPNDVFNSTIGVNIQTMVCHGSMVTVGIYLYASGHVPLKWKTLLKAIPVFAAAVAIAAVLNEIAFFSGLLERESFNMFYISPHCPPHLAVYSLVQEWVPFPWCLLIYIAGFTAAAGAMLLIAMGIGALTQRFRKVAA